MQIEYNDPCHGRLGNNRTHVNGTHAWRLRKQSIRVALPNVILLNLLEKFSALISQPLSIMDHRKNDFAEVNIF